MASLIAESWIYATLLIENQWGGRGTGFLVFRPIDEREGRVFLATNKHVLHPDPQTRKNATRVILHHNVEGTDGSIAARSVALSLQSGDGSRRWREHLDQDVDVLAIEVTQEIVQYPDIKKRWSDYNLFVNQAKLAEFDITIAEEILVIGYPLGQQGFRHVGTNLPLVRAGIVATMIGENLEDECLDADGSIRKRILRGFLIDGAVIPGSSGSPVVLKPTPARFTRKGISLGSPPPPILLGILAETSYAPVQTPRGDIPSFAGLGLAFDAETVRETIELFFA